MGLKAEGPESRLSGGLANAPPRPNSSSVVAANLPLSGVRTVTGSLSVVRFTSHFRVRPVNQPRWFGSGGAGDARLPFFVLTKKPGPAAHHQMV